MSIPVVRHLGKILAPMGLVSFSSGLISPKPVLSMSTAARTNPRRGTSGAKGLLLGGLLLGWTILQSCQSTSSHETGPASVTADFTLASAVKLPDSIDWRSSNSVDAAHPASFKATSLNVAVSITLPEHGRDTVHLGLWAKGMRYGMLVFTYDGTSDRLAYLSSSFDDVALLLLKPFAVDQRPHHDSLIAGYARHLVDGDSGFSGYPRSRPVGLDSVAVLNSALIYAAGQGARFKEISSRWHLDLNSEAAYGKLMELRDSGRVLAEQIVTLFPPYPVRVLSSVAVSSVTVGALAHVKGIFEGDSGLMRLGWAVRMDGSDRSSGFSPAFGANFVPGSTRWDLEADARFTIAPTTATPGRYRLFVWMMDVNGRSDTSSTEFDVHPVRDSIGPRVSILSPIQDSVLETADSTILVRLECVDPSGIDSVTVQGTKGDLKDGTWSRTVHIPATGAIVPIRISAWDKSGNRTESVVRVARKPPTNGANPTLARLAPSDKAGTTLELSDSGILVAVKAWSLAGISDTGIRIGGGMASRDSDSSWSRFVPVAPTGVEKTILIEVVDAAGMRNTDWVSVTRKKDSEGPKIKFVSPSKDTVVAHDCLFLPVRFLVQDASGLDSVEVGGTRIQESIGGGFLAKVELPTVGVAVVVLVKAIDRVGNSSSVQISITRSSPVLDGPFRLVRVAPAQARPNQLSPETDSIQLSWVASSGLGVVDSLSNIAGVRPRRILDSIWTAKIHVPPTGVEIALVAKFVDQGGREATDSVWVVRAKVEPRPRLAVLLDSTAGDPPLRNGIYSTRSDSLRLKWAISGECSGCEFAIDGWRVDPRDGRVEARASLPIGATGHVLRVSFEGKVVGKDSITVHRYPAMKILRELPVSDTLDLSTGSIEVVWKVEHARSVSIGGTSRDHSLDGRYSTRLELKAGSNPVRLTAVDSLGSVDSSVVVLVRTKMVDLVVKADKDTSTQFDSAGFVVSSVTPGAVISVSTDSSSWREIESGGRIWLRSSGRLFVQAKCDGFAPARASTPFVTILHTNNAPWYRRVAPDTIRALEDEKAFRNLWADSVSMGSRWDSSQQGRFVVVAAGNPTGLFSDLPSIDPVSGVLSFALAPDLNGSGKFYVRLRDDGGVVNGGVDSSSLDSFVVLVAPVNDPPRFDAVPKLQAGIVEPYVAGYTLNPLPGGGVDESRQRVKFRFEPINALARECFSISPSYVVDSSNSAPIGATPRYTYYHRLQYFTNKSCPAGEAEFRMVAKDDGGTANGGVDSTVTALRIGLSDSVEVGQGIFFKYKKLGEKFWLLRDLPTKPKDTSSLRTVCPTGWKVPSYQDWLRLVDSIGYDHLRTPDGWTAMRVMQVYGEYPGDNSSGFGVAPDPGNNGSDGTFHLANALYYTSDLSPRIVEFAMKLNPVTEIMYVTLGNRVRCVAD